jgi:hypothetical protein
VPARPPDTGAPAAPPRAPAAAAAPAPPRARDPRIADLSERRRESIGTVEHPAERDPDPRSDGATHAAATAAVTDLQRRLATLAEEELTAARIRAKSVLITAESEARAIVEDADERARQVRDDLTVRAPQAARAQESYLSGVREGWLIGMRKGEIEALRRLESVFSQIESLLGPTRRPAHPLAPAREPADRVDRG